jgi:hypothetical protein
MVAVVNANSVSAAAADHMRGCNRVISFPQITGKVEGKIHFSLWKMAGSQTRPTTEPTAY